MKEARFAEEGEPLIEDTWNELPGQHPELRPAWIIESSNIVSPPTIRVWIRNPPPGMVTELEELLKKYIPE
jgi:hypothetical protein